VHADAVPPGRFTRTHSDATNTLYHPHAFTNANAHPLSNAESSPYA
jgi:hypothetical protein